MKIVSNSFVLLIFIQIIRINFIFIFIKKFYNFYDIIIDDIYVYIYISPNIKIFNNSEHCSAQQSTTGMPPKTPHPPSLE